MIKRHRLTYRLSGGVALPPLLTSSWDESSVVGVSLVSSPWGPVDEAETTGVSAALTGLTHTGTLQLEREEIAGAAAVIAGVYWTPIYQAAPEETAGIMAAVTDLFWPNVYMSMPEETAGASAVIGVIQWS